MRPVSEETKRGITRAVLETADGAWRLTVDYQRCQELACQAVLASGIRFLDEEASRRRGRIRWFSGTDVGAAWEEEGRQAEQFVFRLPGAVTAWMLAQLRPVPWRGTDFASLLRQQFGRWRAEELAAGHDAGLKDWTVPLADHARGLRAAGDVSGARALLRRLATVPMGLPERQELAEIEDDPAAARTAARLVLERAEDGALIERAARVLGVSLPDLASLPVLAAEPGLTGLQLVLIAMPPSDARLLSEAAPIYERMTGIPVRIVRLGQPVDLGAPARFFGQPAVEEDLSKRRGKPVDFTGWDRARFAAELRAAVVRENAVTRYVYDQAAASISDKPLQYAAEPVLDRLVGALAPLRAADRRVMYVGVTEAGLFLPDTLFVFSTVRAAKAGLVSYSAMLARTLESVEESRARLAEWLAKEVVLASLGQLGIPRSEDPADPYSDAPSVARLAAKTLELSPPTRAAIEALRVAP